MNRTLFLWLSALALFDAPGGSAAPLPRMEVTDVKPLLLRALEHGAAHGLLVGPAAAFMLQRFDSASPIEIDVRKLRALPQAGCARLEVTTRQRQVREPSGMADKTLTYEVSYCRDGLLQDRK